jgi:putative membrane protein
MHWTNGGWHLAWMSLSWLVGLAIIVGLVWLALRAGRDRQGGEETAEQILKRRYASGEIDRETYQRMLADLRRTP